MTKTYDGVIVHFNEAVASLLPDEYPQYWTGVVRIIPNWEPGCLIIEETTVSGNVMDGFNATPHRFYRQVVKTTTCIGDAEAGVDKNAGDHDTGWYTQEAIETGISMRGRRVRVVYYPSDEHPDE